MLDIIIILILSVALIAILLITLAVYKSDKKPQQTNYINKVDDDGKKHFYYYTPDGDWIDLCGGDDND